MKIVARHQVRIVIVLYHCILKSLFGDLSLKYLLFDRSRSEKSVNKDSFLLSVSPYSCGSLLVCSRIPVKERENGMRVSQFVLFFVLLFQEQAKS